MSRLPHIPENENEDEDEQREGSTRWVAVARSPQSPVPLWGTTTTRT